MKKVLDICQKNLEKIYRKFNEPSRHTSALAMGGDFTEGYREQSHASMCGEMMARSCENG